MRTPVPAAALLAARLLPAARGAGGARAAGPDGLLSMPSYAGDPLRRGDDDGHPAAAAVPGSYRPHNATRPAGATTAYELVDAYDSTNLFDRFNFFHGNDPTHGFVAYQNRSEATRLGLVSTAADGSARLRVDDATVLTAPRRGSPSGAGDGGSRVRGRPSVRLESATSYREGLIVADFSHLPQPRCGAWPAFWTFAYEPGWPNGGEIDIYEQWNTYIYNRQTLHVNTSFTGNCSLATSYDAFEPLMTNYNYTNDCNVTEPENVGCSTWDFEGPYASRAGGVYALEISRAANAVRLWSWHHDAVPPDLAASVASSSPLSRRQQYQYQHQAPLPPLDPSSWGAPGLLAGGAGCDVGRTFANQTIVMNIALCGDAAGGDEWAASGCAAETGYNSCERYVAANPGDFADVWFGVRSIKVYQARG